MTDTRFVRQVLTVVKMLEDSCPRFDVTRDRATRRWFVEVYVDEGGCVTIWGDTLIETLAHVAMFAEFDAALAGQRSSPEQAPLMLVPRWTEPKKH